MNCVVGSEVTGCCADSVVVNIVGIVFLVVSNWVSFSVVVSKLDGVVFDDSVVLIIEDVPLLDIVVNSELAEVVDFSVVLTVNSVIGFVGIAVCCVDCVD